MKASGLVGRVWQWVRWPLLVVVLLCVAYVVWGLTLVAQKDKDDAAVAAIYAQKLTMADVLGTNLPPVPNQIENDATVAGIDANNNGIRDDVELAIFKKYPGTSNEKVRAAELQYALTEQMFLTKVNDTATWKAVAEESDRAYRCIFQNFRENIVPANVQLTSQHAKEVENLIFNTTVRVNQKDKAYDYTISYGSLPENSCDVSL